MQIQFIKDHLAHKAGDIAEVAEASANYLIRVKVAQIVTEKEEVEVQKEKKERKPAKEKKEK